MFIDVYIAMKKVVILGSGIGGLSCAHELAKNSNYEVHVIERNSTVGGLARSTKTWALEEKSHSEVCWKAVSSGYVYFLNILNEIIDDEGNKVISHLKPITNFIYAMDNKIVNETGNSFITKNETVLSGFRKLYGKSVSFADKMRLVKFLCISHLSCDERVRGYDSVLWADYVSGCSPELKRWILDSTSIYLGMDYKKISLHFMVQLIRDSYSSPLLSNDCLFYAFDGPMHKVLLDVWKKQLERDGVVFHMESNVVSMDARSDTIKTVTFSHRGCAHTISADIVVNAVGCESLPLIYPKNRITNADRYEKLAERGHQIQTQIIFYLPKSVLKGADPTIIIFPDTPWFLMTRVDSTLWDTEYEVLSTGIGIWDTAGLLGKPAIHCTREELAQDCWEQIKRSQHNLKLGNVLPSWDIWYSFKYSDEKNQIDSVDPKFSNNVGTLALRPQCKDSALTNLYHATAYTRTRMNIYNMESAAEAGVKTAALIRDGELIESTRANVNPLIRLLRWFDRWSYRICG